MEVKKILILVMVMFLLTLPACGKSEKENKSVESSEVSDIIETSSENVVSEDVISYPKMDEIEWLFINSIRYEEPVAVFCYTNNSDFTIVRLDLSFEMKDDIGSEQLQAFESLKEKREITDDDIVGFTPEIHDYMVCDPGEKVEGAPCYLSYNMEPTDISQCELLNLKYAEIFYIGSDDKIHKVSYSAENSVYVVAEPTDELYLWSDSEYASIVPRPETRIVTVDYDEDDYFQCTAYDMSIENYEAYIDECKEAGFDNDVEESASSFWGKNAQGYKLHVRYFDYMNAIEISIKQD